MHKSIKQAMIGLMLLASGFAASPAAAAATAMPTAGRTSQPVGHYDFCKRYPSTCQRNASVVAVKMTRSNWDKLVQINAAVNNNVMPRTDQEVYGVPEYWAYPTTEGDCEDFALLKQYMLSREGFPASALLITVVRQTNGDGHAVLTVRTDQGDYILDNLDARILAWNDTDYQYLKRQSEANAGQWTTINDDRNILVGSVR